MQTTISSQYSLLATTPEAAFTAQVHAKDEDIDMVAQLQRNEELMLQLLLDEQD